MFGAMLEELLTKGTLGGENREEKISVIAELRAKAGHEEEIRVLLQSLVEPSRAEAGCLTYHLLEDTRQPGSFSSYQEWTGVQAFQDHVAGEVASAVMAKAQPMTDGVRLKVLRMLV